MPPPENPMIEARLTIAPPPAPRDHAARRDPRAQEHAGQIDRDDLFPIRQRMLDGGMAQPDPGAIARMSIPPCRSTIAAKAASSDASTVTSAACAEAPNR